MTTDKWITKYALTRGIYLASGNLSEDGRYFYYPPNGLQAQIPRKDFHDSLDAALARACEMRDAKIASLYRQIAKLRAMDWSEGA